MQRLYVIPKTDETFVSINHWLLYFFDTFDFKYMSVDAAVTALDEKNFSNPKGLRI